MFRALFWVGLLPFLLFHNVRNKIFRIATAIPKIGDFYAVFKYAIDYLV